MSNLLANSWTDEETNRLRELRAEGHPYAVIACRMGRTSKSVNSKMRRLKLTAKAKPLSVDNIRAAFAARLEGQTLAAIGRMFGVSEHTIGSLLLGETYVAEIAALGLSPFSPSRHPVRDEHGVSWTEAETLDLRKSWDEGESATLIGRRLGRTKNSVIGRVHRLGLKPHGNPRNFVQPKPRQNVVRASHVTLPSLASLERPRPVAQPLRVTPLSPPSSPSPETQEQTMSSPVELLQRSQHTCRRPLWADDAKRPTHQYCPNEAPPGSSYCYVCAKIMYANFNESWRKKFGYWYKDAA